ncbi:MAG: hypothetical protein KC479_00940 [Dehalococcoidia bacterium]|nr:hypothetical protein [Dehalococcoidia bacterium]
MIRKLTILPLLATLLLGASLMPTRADAAHDFTGVWTSVDPVDDSFQVMSVGFSDSPRVVLIDFNATVACDGGGIAIASGRGSVSDGHLTGDFRVRCLVQGIVSTGVGFDFTLIDNETLSEAGPNPNTWARLF